MALDFPSSPTNGQTYSANNITWVYETSTTTWKVKQDGATGKTRVATVKDLKGNRVGGGQITANSWTTRDLNTISDLGNIGISVNTNVITIPAGTYRIKWRCPSWRVYTFQTKLEYSTDNTFGSGVSKVLGSSEFSSSQDDSKISQSSSEGVAPSLTFSETTYVRIRQWAGVTGPAANNGLGVATYNDVADTETGEDTLYSVVEIEDLATAIKESEIVNTGKTKVARIYEARSGNTDAGSPPDTAYHNRILNTKDDPHSFVSWPSGASLGTGGTNTYFSLAPGSYKINWRAPANAGRGYRSKLVYANNNSFTSSSEVLGESGISQDAGWEPNQFNCGTAILTTTQTTYFKIQQAQATGNWGLACEVGGVEIYTQVFVEDLATAVKEPSGTDIPVGGIIMYSGTQTALNELTNWKLCDGNNGTPNLSDKFIIAGHVWDAAAGWKTAVTGSNTQSGGSKDAVVVQHNHTYVTKGATFTGDFHDEATGAWRTDTTANTGDSGETGTNKNLPPYFALAYIMRVS